MTEAAAQYPVDGPIVLRARVDLVIGKPVGHESRKVIIDLKSGRIVDRHREDLRFYALVETLCRDVPPRRLASFSLDAGTAVVEDVTPALLRSTLRRTLDAVERMIELRHEGRPAERTPGVTCRWCPLATDCAPGRRTCARRPTTTSTRETSAGVIKATGKPEPGLRADGGDRAPRLHGRLRRRRSDRARGVRRPRRGPRR